MHILQGSKLLPKDLRFEHGGAKLASCPGRHITSLRPWSLKYHSEHNKCVSRKKNVVTPNVTKKFRMQARNILKSEARTRPDPKNPARLTTLVCMSQLFPKFQSPYKSFIF